jgi:ligand-binding sensor domain-containing protein
MFSFKKKKERLLTVAVIAVSMAGILYFGYKAIRDYSARSQGNPFEYDIEAFRKSDASLVHYTEVGQISIELKAVFGVTVGPDDRIYVSGSDSLLIFNEERILQSSISIVGPAYCLFVDRNHDLYLGMDDHVEVFDRMGQKISSWESLGEKAIITSIAVSENNVFVADAGNHIVWKFDKSGKRLKRIGAKDRARDIPGFIIPSPFFDVAMDPDGFLWVANTGRHSLENYTPDGDFRTSWGEFSMKIEGFSGCCNPSHFAILEDGSFVTSEKGLARVKVYNRIGDLVSVVATPDQFLRGTVGLDLAVDSSQRIYVLDPWQRLVRIFEKKEL